jgi:hypothetical protein
LCICKNQDFFKRIFELYGKRTFLQAVPYVNGLEKNK